MTGASGYVGLAVVEALVDKGYYVRALARPTSKLQHLQELGVEIFLGDVRRLQDVNAAAAGMDVIVHAAAGMKGSAESIVDTCVRGTHNVGLAASEQGVSRVLYISSFSVYNYTQLKDGQCIDENSPLEDEPETRGAYTIGKTHADKIARSHLIDEGPAWTILRPSLVVGNGSRHSWPGGATNRQSCNLSGCSE